MEHLAHNATLAVFNPAVFQSLRIFCAMSSTFMTSRIALSFLRRRAATHGLGVALALASFSGLFLSPLAQAQQGVPQLNLPIISLNAGMYVIQAQVATTPEEREIGLMFRKAIRVNEGMLFVFDQPGMQCFWMKNTLIPLTATFIADDGTIINTADMKAMTTDTHCSAAPVRYVLETSPGWLAQHGFGPGKKLSGRPFN